MYNDKQLIILTAGKSTRLFPLTIGTPKCLLSVKQKPAIYNMLIPMVNKGLRDIIFVVNKENERIIKDFNKYIFETLNLNINYIVQEDFSGPGGALYLTKDYITKPTILLLGDTICNIPNKFKTSWIATKVVPKNETYKYCMVEYNDNNEIINMIDKPDKSELSQAIIGMYYFNSPTNLKTAINNMKKEKIFGEYQLSIIFKEYMKIENIYLYETDYWLDIGNLEDYTKVNKEMFNCRNFNDLEIEDSILYKKSNYEKITSEYNWFNKVKGTLFEKYSPKFYDDCVVSNGYGIEFYDYLTLSEYFTFYPLSDYSRKYIFEQLVNLLLSIYKSTRITDSKEFIDLFKTILIDKTRKRINKWNRKDLVNLDKIIINNKEYVGLNKALSILEKDIIKICNESKKNISIIHGDPAFSNILFSPRTTIFKFIDPRGNFGKDTAYGDYRYDIAKLRHCYQDSYDDIINDLFEIEETDNNISIKLYKKYNYEIFDKILIENGINIDDIELIEALLFISMIPLHSDYPKRQLAFFTNGIILLNNQLKQRGY